MRRMLISIFAALTILFLLSYSAAIAAPRAIPYEAGVIQLDKLQLSPPAISGKPVFPQGAPLDFPDALIFGSKRLANLQSGTDGGWDWEVDSSQNAHSGNPSPINTYGVTAMGILGAYLHKPQAFQQTAIQNAFTLGIEPNLAIKTGGVPQFLIKAKQALGTTAYADTGKSRYDVRKADAGGTAGDRARQIRDGRCGSGYCNGIIPWDIGLVAADAYAVFDEYGTPYDDDVDSMAQVIYDILYTTSGTYFDLADRNEWWWTLGVTGSLEAFALSGNFPTERDQMLDSLLKYQLPDGSWEWHGGVYGGVGDWQTTAYAVRALATYDNIVGSSAAKAAAKKGANWLKGQQSWYNAGWFYHNVSVAVDDYCENTEVDGECLWAIYLAGPPFVVPAFTSYGYIALPAIVILLGAGILFFRRRKAFRSF